MSLTHVAWAVYAVGALVALARSDAGWGTRLLLALLWPVGPAAFVVTVAMLVAVGMVAFPIFGAVVVALAGGAWYWLG